jgi:NAD(P)-dependent dehydrogenase (short-subunit alcohol dehydrogenase family)
MQLKDKTAIITGARGGMGRTHALALAKEGANVVVSDISLEDCQKVVDEIKGVGGEAIAVKCDVTKKQEIEDMIKQTLDKFKKIDILINNAGILQFKPFLELTEEDWDKMLAVNLRGYFLCSQACAKEMVKQKSGVIVNISSIAMGQVGVGFPQIVHYCAAKGGITAMTEAMALELSPFNIRVNAIAPGAIDTPMAAATKQDPKVLEGALARIPMHRMGNPEEVSNVVVFLASDKSSYMTGSVVVVDGGYLAM